LADGFQLNEMSSSEVSQLKTVVRLGCGGRRFLVLKHEEAAAPKLRNPLRSETLTNETKGLAQQIQQSTSHHFGRPTHIFQHHALIVALGVAL
jgi:hypothetical protein